jgi:hypothetical protein
LLLTKNRMSCERDTDKCRKSSHFVYSRQRYA